MVSPFASKCCHVSSNDFRTRRLTCRTVIRQFILPFTLSDSAQFRCNSAGRLILGTVAELILAKSSASILPYRADWCQGASVPSPQFFDQDGPSKSYCKT